MDIEKTLKDATTVHEHIPEPLQIQLSFGGKESMPAILKMAINYYHEKYLELSRLANDKIVESNSTLRGRILDKFGNVLVDNKGINVLIYTKIPNITSKDELKIASLIAKTINLDNYDITELSLKEYLYKKYKTNIDEKVSELKLEKYKERRISENDFTNYKYSLIDGNLITDENRKEAVIYNLMNKGYSYQDKVIKKNITDEELTKINELNLKGIRIDIDYIRVYKYDTSLNQIFGSIGKIEKEKKEYYLSKGYKLDATVGVSFLESTYENQLVKINKGTIGNITLYSKFTNDGVFDNDGYFRVSTLQTFINIPKTLNYNINS